MSKSTADITLAEKRAAAVRICERLREAGYRALLAGGCVRDEILGLSPRDYDIATSARPDDVGRLFDRCIPVGVPFGVQMVLLPEGQFEVTTFRHDGPYTDGRHPDYVEYSSEQEDALRRDFTINAMFLDPETNQVLDFVRGRQDLRDHLVRTVGEPRKRFEEDHLRLLRAVRFAARLNYEIVPETYAAMGEMAESIKATSAERIRDEIVKILTEGGVRKAMYWMLETGLLEQVLPEVAAMRGVQQPEEFHPEGDVFEHTVRMLELMDHPTPTLAFGALLHDVGKPITQTFEDRIRFNYHDKVGARESQAIGQRLRLSNDQIERIVWLVENHMRVAAIPEMKENRRKRFVRDESFPELLELCRLDCLASHGDLSGIRWVEDYVANLAPDDLRPPPLLRGTDLIEMGYKPGPLFKEILQAVEDGQLDGTLSSTGQARTFVSGRWPH